MAQPTSIAEFKAYCLRQLGAPVIRVELSDDQQDDAVDNALTKFREYHYDATTRTYLKHTVTSTDMTNKYLPIDDTIQSVVKCVAFSEANMNIFDVRYQLRLQDFYNFSNVSMVHYVITMEKLALIDWLLNAKPTVSFNRLTNKLYLNIDWANKVAVGDILVFEVYKQLSETVDTKMWSDQWLKKYATALMRLQWGSNLKKFPGVQLLGGVTLNGQQVYEEAKDEVATLETELYRDYQPPTRIFIG